MNWRHLGRLVSSKEVATFFVFFLLSFVIWLLYTIGTQREITMIAPVAYYGVPDDVKMETELPKSIEFTIEDEGSQVWRYFFAEVDTIEIDMTDKFAGNRRRNIKIDFEGYAKDIAYGISQTCKIISVNPSDFHSDYHKVLTKRVPVVLTSMPQTDSEFAFSAPVTISPSTVRIRGSRSKVNAVQCIYADSITELLTESKDLIVKLKKVPGIEILDKAVRVRCQVERMTEKEFVLPVTMKNVPEGMTVKVFPKEASVVFKVGLSRYKNLNVSGLDIIFDYTKIEEGKPTNELYLECKEPLVGVEYKIVPSEAEFIIEK